MIVPYLSAFDSVAANLRSYRQAYARAGHEKGGGKVQMSFHLYVAEDGTTARREAREPMEEYIRLFKLSSQAWRGRSSQQYQGYEKLESLLEAITYDRVVAETRAFIGDPIEIATQFVPSLLSSGQSNPACR